MEHSVQRIPQDAHILVVMSKCKKNLGIEGTLLIKTQRIKHMKNFVISLLFIFFFFGTNHANAQKINNMLPAFNLTYISGCNSITYSKINIYLKDGKYYADHISPTYFDGIEIDSLWTVELNENSINSCIAFINKAKSLPRKCDHYTSSENHYIIALGKDTIDINGDCDWNNLDFDYLDQQLFITNHFQIEEKKTQFLKNLDKKLYGKWYLQPLNRALKKDDIVIFSRTKITDSYLEFGNNSSLKGHCSKLLGIHNSKRYQTEISDGWNETVVTFDWGKITDKRDYNIWYEYGATFTLVSITNDELKLNYLWK